MSKKQVPTQSTPRKAEEIRQEYYQSVARLGELDYQQEIFKQERGSLVGKVRNLNYEMDARNKLDQAVQAEAQAKAAAEAAAKATEAATPDAAPAPTETPAPSVTNEQV